ncbi:MAG: hypothetical protein L6Q57_07660 [Alphaproteobacteria bacterium]|nr:hypothetical protein [Alphaproteobacteria bacterium]
MSLSELLIGRRRRSGVTASQNSSALPSLLETSVYAYTRLIQETPESMGWTPLAEIMSESPKALTLAAQLEMRSWAIARRGDDGRYTITLYDSSMHFRASPKVGVRETLYQDGRTFTFKDAVQILSNIEATLKEDPQRRPCTDHGTCQGDPDAPVHYSRFLAPAAAKPDAPSHTAPALRT